MQEVHAAPVAMVAILIAATLCGCSAFREQVAQQDDAECRSHGALPGTAEYTDCRLRLRQEHIAAFSQAWTSTGASMRNAGNCANLPAAEAFACGAAGTR
jgi:Tfp pilus assembly protein PilV